MVVVIGFLFGLIKVVDINLLDIENLIRDEDVSDMVKEYGEDILDNGKGKVGDVVMLEEFLNKIMSFLKDCMLDVKLKVFKVVFLFVVGKVYVGCFV